MKRLVYVIQAKPIHFEQFGNHVGVVELCRLSETLVENDKGINEEVLKTSIEIFFVGILACEWFMVLQVFFEHVSDACVVSRVELREEILYRGVRLLT